MVVDANILFNAILKQDGSTHKLLFSPKLKFAMPDYVFQELAKYEKRFANKWLLYQEYIQNFLARDVMIYQTELLRDIIQEIKPRMDQIDPKDTPYVALAYKLKIPLRTNDKAVLDKASTHITTISTEAIVRQYCI